MAVVCRISRIPYRVRLSKKLEDAIDSLQVLGIHVVALKLCDHCLQLIERLMPFGPQLLRQGVLRVLGPGYPDGVNIDCLENLPCLLVTGYVVPVFMCRHEDIQMAATIGPGAELDRRSVYVGDLLHDRLSAMRCEPHPFQEQVVVLHTSCFDCAVGMATALNRSAHAKRSVVIFSRILPEPILKRGERPKAA
mgnify:CR=1 FL=1